MRMHILLMLGLAAGPACTPDVDTDTDTGAETDTSAVTSAGTSAGVATIGGGDENPYVLGDHASEVCLGAMARAGEFLAATAADDAAAAASAYVDPLRAYIHALDAGSGRADDAAIIDALAEGGPTGAALAEGHLHAALAAHLRAELAAVAEKDTPDKYTAWDEAYCVWSGGLRELGERVDAKLVLGGFPILSIENFFHFGHQAISGEPPTTSIDEWIGPSNIQQIEKTLLRAAHHDIFLHADQAWGATDGTAAARARGVLAVVRDQIEGRNTPGLAAIEAMLTGDPSLIDARFVLFELDIAFAKHAREAVDQTAAAGFGSPASHAHAVAGRGYAEILAPGMIADSPKIDTYPSYVDWDRYIALARHGDDDAEALAVGQRLIDFTCAYQTALGVAACTGTDDEPQP